MGASLMHSMVFTLNSVSNNINVLINCSQLSRSQAVKVNFGINATLSV
ncbi:F-box domain-containing protein [Psidium guajava]|nr:F-box domain-containing protein [Psidium guajava]